MWMSTAKLRIARGIKADEEYSPHEQEVWTRIMHPAMCARVLSTMAKTGTFSVSRLIEGLWLVPHSDVEICLIRLTLSLWNLGILSAVEGCPSSIEDSIWQWRGLNNKIPNYLHLPHVPEDPKTLEGPF